MPVADALAVAQQIAEALEAAHECGVIHRDLKPANVKVTPDERVKVLDFGLAKAIEADQAAAVDTNSPTLSMRATQMGVILGTAAYMSPEQSKGARLESPVTFFHSGSCSTKCWRDGGRSTATRSPTCSRPSSSATRIWTRCRPQ